jgi:hypothetical protein
MLCCPVLTRGGIACRGPGWKKAVILWCSGASCCPLPRLLPRPLPRPLIGGLPGSLLSKRKRKEEKKKTLINDQSAFTLDNKLRVIDAYWYIISFIKKKRRKKDHLVNSVCMHWQYFQNERGKTLKINVYCKSCVTPNKYRITKGGEISFILPIIEIKALQAFID